MRLILPFTVWLGLACGGVELPDPDATPDPVPEPAPAAPTEPAPDDAEAPSEEDPDLPPWVLEAVSEALDYETMPGTTREDDPAREAALRDFFLAHPEYETKASRAPLGELACRFSTEEAHERLKNPTPPIEMALPMNQDDWKLVVAYSTTFCTSDEWSWFTHEVAEAMAADGVAYAYADAEVDRLVITRGDARIDVPLEGQGYVFVAAGREPHSAGHDLSESVIDAARAYFQAGE